MADLVIAEKQSLVNIADAIRNKVNETAKMTLDEMPNKISRIGANSQPTITVHSGAEAAMTSNLGKNGDIYLVTG